MQYQHYHVKCKRFLLKDKINLADGTRLRPNTMKEMHLELQVQGQNKLGKDTEWSMEELILLSFWKL